MVDDSSLVLQEIFYQPWSQANIFGLMAPDNHICLTSMSGDCALLRSNKTHLALETIELRFPSGPADIDSGKSHSVDSLKRLGLQLELCCSDSVMVGDYFLLACGYVIESHDDTKETQSEYFGLSIFTIDPSIKPSSADESTTSSKGMQFVSTEHVDVKSIPAMLKFLNLQVLNGNHIQNGVGDEMLDLLLIVSKFDEVISYRMKQHSDPPVFEGCLLDEAMPELQRLPKPLVASMISLDSALIVDENCRVTVVGFDDGDLLILRTELSQKKTESTLTVKFDTPVCAAKLFFIQDRSITMSLGKAATVSASSEIFLVTSSALGPVVVFSEVDIITGRVTREGSQSLAETSQVDCITSVYFSLFRSGNDWKELLLIGTHARAMLIYSREDDIFNFVKIISFPSPVMCIDKVTFAVFDCPVVITATSVHIFTVS